MCAFQREIFIFDVDGTLTDTGKAHAIFCNDLNTAGNYGLPIVDPADPAAVKAILGTPMSTILRKYGFPEEETEYLDTIYSIRFKQNIRYASRPFEGVPELLAKLRELEMTIVLLTSNTENNVKRDMGEKNFRLADRCIDRDFLDNHFPKQPQDTKYSQKGAAINHLIRREFDATIPNGCFTVIGDTTKDFEAAEHAQCRFIGVSYGWEIEPNDPRFPVANTVKELSNLLKLN